MPYNLDAVAQYIAIRAAARPDLWATQAEEVKSDRERPSRALGTLSGLTVYPSQANFVLVRTPDAERLRQDLAYAGIANADPEIRQHLDSDRKNMLGADDSFTDEILFWKGPKTDPGNVVDADAEARRIDAEKAGQAPGHQPKPEAPKEEEDKSGWFDGWFDWF